ncbi:hypothetical protein BC835DRAFT_1374610 [Cytidiella melzeri]|nr:hypothetical protein BC835DRAFT_1374610 [Cytidiella melzeri]
MVDRHRAFDRTALLPDYLQDRLDGWQANPPAHQHQTYGPWNAYLQGQKFLAEHFLVKPQALLREETATNANDMSIESIDSHGTFAVAQQLIPRRSVFRVRQISVVPCLTH